MTGEFNQNLIPPGPPPSSMYATTPATGRISWAVGFIAYLPIPFLSQLAAVIMMVALYPSQRKKGPLAAENARHAANWGLSYLAVTVVLAGIMIGLAIYSNSITDEAARRDASQVPLVLLGIWFIGLNALHAVVVIMGTVRSSRGEIFRNRVQIPFFRSPW